jgi:hypothetical protein
MSLTARVECQLLATDTCCWIDVLLFCEWKSIRSKYVGTRDRRRGCSQCQFWVTFALAMRTEIWEGSDAKKRDATLMTIDVPLGVRHNEWNLSGNRERGILKLNSFRLNQITLKHPAHCLSLYIIHIRYREQSLNAALYVKYYMKYTMLQAGRSRVQVLMWWIFFKLT